MHENKNDFDDRNFFGGDPGPNFFGTGPEDRPQGITVF